MNASSPSNRERLRQIARRAMRERGLEPDFSAAVLAEADAAREWSGAVLSHDPAPRDLRHLLWASIDNDDSRDLDQLTVAEPLGAGATRVLVAIADVDSAVPRGSAVDLRARQNTTSVYTAAQIFPMLPERLSTDLTSLGDGEERLAIVVELEVDGEGAVGKSEVYAAVVRNRAKLAYNSVAAWLDGAAPSPARLAAVPGLEEQLRLQDRVAQAMKALRHRHGALGLETPESRPVFDGDLLADLRPDEKNRATQLIEDFMIAANGATARFLEARGFPSLRRVLHAPERWDRLERLAADLGDTLPPDPDGAALEGFLVRRRSAAPETFQELSLTVVKLLGAGEYAVDLPGTSADGHFGLAMRDYGHSTAPNRRYPDLATQRLLKAALVGQPVPYTIDELTALATHCTRQEDNANKVERQVRKSAAALLLASRVGERFDALVTGAASKGTWARVFRPPVEGRIVRGAAGLEVGDRLQVELLGVDVDRGFIDFARV